MDTANIQTLVISIVGLVVSASVLIIRRTIMAISTASLPALVRIESVVDNMGKDMREVGKKIDQLSFSHDTMIEKHAELRRYMEDTREIWDKQSEQRLGRIEKLERKVTQIETRLQVKKEQEEASDS